jgi:hypothetical protein
MIITPGARGTGSSNAQIGLVRIKESFPEESVVFE